MRIINPIISQIFIDRGAFKLNNVPLDYFEFLNPELLVSLDIKPNRKEFTVREQRLILDRISVEHNKFLVKIIEKRKTAFELNSTEVQDKYSCNTNLISLMFDVAIAILKNERIRNSLTNICNCDKRSTLESLVDFVIFLEKRRFIPFNKDFVLESEYNKWILRRSNVMNFTPLNFVRNFTITTPPKILLNYIVLNIVSNLTDVESISSGWEVRTDISKILNRLLQIVSTKNEVFSAIRSLIYDNGTAVGLLECENISLFESNDFKLPPNLNIWITPRARTLKSYSIYTFNFLYALLIRENYSVNNIVLTDDIVVKSEKTMIFIFDFLSKFGKTHLVELKLILNTMVHQSHFVNREEAFDEYLKYFSLFGSNDKPSEFKSEYYNENKNTLVFQKILISHWKFIKGQDLDERFDVTQSNFWQQKYVDLFNLYNRDLKSLILHDNFVLSSDYFHELALTEYSKRVLDQKI